MYVAEKIEISRHAAEVKNRGGFIIEAIRENYQNSEVQKARELRAEKVREKELEDLTAEFRVKRDNIIRQAVHADPALVERAAKHIHSYIVRERLHEHDSALVAYQKGGMVTAEINAILAAEFCQELLAPVVEAYENETGFWGISFQFSVFSFQKNGFRRRSAVSGQQSAVSNQKEFGGQQYKMSRSGDRSYKERSAVMGVSFFYPLLFFY